MSRLCSFYLLRRKYFTDCVVRWIIFHFLILLAPSVTRVSRTGKRVTSTPDWFCQYVYKCTRVQCIWLFPDTMYVASMFPPVPPLEDQNVHHAIFGADQRKRPDYTLYINADTGRKHTYYEFLERVYDGATFLGTPVSEGGLGISAENGEVIGILSDNCMVSSAGREFTANDLMFPKP